MPSASFARAPQRHVAPRASAVFGRTRLRAPNANGVGSRGIQGQDFLYPKLMLPAVTEVIHVFKAFVRLEAKVGESDFIRMIGEGDAALVSDAVLLSVNDE